MRRIAGDLKSPRPAPQLILEGAKVSHPSVA